MAGWKLAVAAMAMVASNAQAACLTRVEAEQALVAILPSILEGVAKRCANLGASTPAMVALAVRYQPEAGAAWPAARKIVVRIWPDAKPIVASNEAEARIRLIPFVADQLGGEIKNAAECSMIDRVIGPLSPLPANNAAQFLVAATEAVAAKGDSDVLTICPEPAQ